VRRTLPPLNAVRAFEASARLGGFGAAARELGVSPAAVSLQVRNLETHFGAALFRRRANGVTLTEIGEAAFADCAEALGTLAGLSARIAGERSPERVTLSAGPSLATPWLTGTLAAFLRAEPEIRIDLREESDPVSFARDGLDLRIAYGAHIYPDCRVTPLFTDEVAPLASPGLAAALGLDAARPAAIPDDRLIHLSWWTAVARFPGWADWFAEAGAPRDPDRARGCAAATSAGALALAAQGVGVALGQRFLSRRLVAEGRLVAPFDRWLALPHAFALVAPPARARRPAVRRLTDWLVEDVRGAVEGLRDGA
jgi:LysR family glycine cleavage system transcriptional activator